MAVTKFLDLSRLPHRSQEKPIFDRNMGEFYRQLPEYGAELNSTLQQADAAQAAATVQATAAEASAQNAQAAMGLAIAAADAAPWVSGRTYAKNAAAISQVNFQIYRRMVAGAGTTDPADDTVNVWAPQFGNGSFTPRAAPTATFDLSSGNFHQRTVSASETWVFDKCPGNGFGFAVEMTYTGGNVGFPSSVKTGNNVVYSFTAGKTYLLMFVTSNRGARWRMAVSEPYDS